MFSKIRPQNVSRKFTSLVSKWPIKFWHIFMCSEVLFRMVKTAGLYLVPIKSYSKNGHVPYILASTLEKTKRVCAFGHSLPSYRFSKICFIQAPLAQIFDFSVTIEWVGTKFSLKIYRILLRSLEVSFFHRLVMGSFHFKQLIVVLEFFDTVLSFLGN